MTDATLAERLRETADGDIRETRRDTLVGGSATVEELTRWADLMDEAANALTPPSRDELVDLLHAAAMSAGPMAGLAKWQAMADAVLALLNGKSAPAEARAQ